MLEIKSHKKEYHKQRYSAHSTILIIEKTLMNADKVISIAELKRRLPKQVMHQTLMSIIDYLEYSGKIVVHNHKVLWTHNPRSKLRRAISRGTEI